jgi:hypothetical protein
MERAVVQVTEWLREADRYVLNVLELAWRAFADTTHLDPMAIIMSPGMISIGTLLVLGFGWFVVRR